MSSVDQAKNAEAFLADTVHEDRLDKLLWMMRMRRDAAARLVPVPHFAFYNRLNAWGKHRDVPEAASETFHEWYKNHRLKANEVLGL